MKLGELVICSAHCHLLSRSGKLQGVQCRMSSAETGGRFLSIVGEIWTKPSKSRQHTVWLSVSFWPESSCFSNIVVRATNCLSSVSDRGEILSENLSIFQQKSGNSNFTTKYNINNCYIVWKRFPKSLWNQLRKPTTFIFRKTLQ